MYGKALARSTRRVLPTLVITALVAPSAFSGGVAHAVEDSRFRPAVVSTGGVVSSISRQASEAAIGVLDEGGNAVDAAIAAAFSVGVARPETCGIGGGGFLVYRSAAGAVDTLDFREVAPLLVEEETFESPGMHNKKGNPASPFTATGNGHRVVGVPGFVAGLATARDKYGTKPLNDLIAPAERLARDGVEVTFDLATEIFLNQQRLGLYDETANIYLVGGASPYPPGATLVQTDYADTLARIMTRGPSEFYTGLTAQLIAADMEAAEADGRTSPRLNAAYPSGANDFGLMRPPDLAAYQPIWRSALQTRYRGHQVFTVPPPGGGLAVVEMLNVLEGFDLAGMGQLTVDHIHTTAETQKLVKADTDYYGGDPAYEDVPTEILASRKYARMRRAALNLEIAAEYGPGDVGGSSPPQGRGHHGGNKTQSTTHVSVIDTWGNAVALTCSLGFHFGSAVVAKGTGFLLNNQMYDFDRVEEDEPGSVNNDPAAGKRPASNQSPTIVVSKGKPILVTGAAGGEAIPMGALHQVINVVDFKVDIARAVDAPRWDYTAIYTDDEGALGIEAPRVPEPVLQELEQVKKHRLSRKEAYHWIPIVQNAGIELSTGTKLASPDPRKEGTAMGQR
jgi:gamma-glutamyltranspeptidase/glutathione hydrolase